jgi:hypothetical protein
MSEEAPSTVLRSKAARVLRLARSVADERARASLLDYVQELIERAEQLEQETGGGRTGVAALRPGVEELC